MAQTLQEQDTSQRETSNFENKPSSQVTVNKEGPKVKRALKFSIATSQDSSQVNSPPATVSPIQTSLTARPLLISRSQPSKCFITKCHAELEALLNLIREKYNEEIKTLWNSGEAYADLFIHIGEDFKKPLHKCVLASRAFKLFNTLKAFEINQHPVEKDIIISEFQNKSTDSALDKEPVEKDEQSNEVEEDNDQIFDLNLNIPEGLISPELLNNFLRITYLDQDLNEEEIRINQCAIDWLKVNRPDLIRMNVKHSPDHKESFRTIQPDFENLTISKSSSVMSGDLDKKNLSDELETFSPRDLEEVSFLASSKEECLTNPLLTRTETFELITKSIPEGSSVDPSKNDELADAALSASRSDNGDELSSSEASIPPYAPTTRTGLKPKTFTTPVNLRSSRNTTSTSKKSKTNVPATTNEKSAAGNGPIRQVSNKLLADSELVSGKPSSSTQPNEFSPNSHISKQATNSSCNRVKTSGKVTKVTSITRAHPISLERSQSPATNVISKGSSKNFIAANKRLVSQIEKKVVSAPVDQAVIEPEAETTDTSYILDPLMSDNLTAHMDKLTLISQSKLADALSRLFIDSNLSDTTILTKDGRQVAAHKCILAARSAYLAEAISKQIQSLSPDHLVGDSLGRQMLKIDLSEFSYSTIYFAIIHIYSGFAKVPDDIDIDELMSLTHLLHISTLTQICMHHLRMNYCHFFHKPCNVCCLGVLKTLPLAWRYDYTELYSKCLQWIGSHFASVFCLKEFSELKPHDLLEECYMATLSQLTPDNIIPKTIECQRLLKNLPRVKWTESIICMVGRQLEDFCHYVADNYEKILQSESFLSLGNNCWECEVLEENLLAAMNHLKPDSGCKTLIQLHKIECSIESYSEETRNVSDSFASLVSKMRKYCERYLLKDAAAVVHCSAWRHMNPSLQKRIKDQAIISTDFDEPSKHLTAKPKLPSMSRVTSQQQQQSNNFNNSSDGNCSSSNRSTPETRIKSPSTTYLPPPKNKIPAARHVKVLK